MNEAHNPLYPRCTKFYFLIFFSEVNAYRLNNWNSKSFDMLLELLKDAFPIDIFIPKSFYEAKRKVCDLG